MKQFLLGVLVGGGIATTAVMWLYGGNERAPAKPAIARSATPTTSAGPASTSPAPKVAGASTPTHEAKRAGRDASTAAHIERDALKQQIKTLEARLTDQADTLKHYIGEALPFPDDLDPIYKEDELMERFSAALEALGVDGEVSEIDCTEFPCIVYGKVQDDDGTQVGKLREAKALSPYEDAWRNSSVWSGKAMVDGKPSQNAAFGFALMPKGAVDEAAVQKRLRFRHQAYWNAIRDELHDKPAE